MLFYIIRRFLFMIIILLALSVVSFVIIQLPYINDIKAAVMEDAEVRVMNVLSGEINYTSIMFEAAPDPLPLTISSNKIVLSIPAKRIVSLKVKLNAEDKMTNDTQWKI